MTPTSTVIPEFFPWFESARQQMLADRARLAHAWLLHGQAGMGQVEFSFALAKALLCESPPNQTSYCGQCQACHWFDARNHPDLRIVRPQALEEQLQTEDEEAPAASDDKKASQEIKIEQIRALERWINVGTHRGGQRVILLYPAQALNQASANALLKTLEEPSTHTLFLLVTDQPARLMPTILSRCRQLALPSANPAQAQDWLAKQGIKDAAQALAAAGGAPLAAAVEDADQTAAQQIILNMVYGKTDALNAAEQLSKLPTPVWVDQLQRVLSDIALVQATCKPRYFPAQQAVLAKAAGRSQPQRLFAYAQDLSQRRALAMHPLNGRLFAESALLEFERVLGQ